MARGPFADGLKAVYTLQFPDFSVQAHLKSLNTYQAAAVGLDVTGQNLEALMCDPLEGDPRILDGMTATVNPSFRGLEGAFTVKGRPESRLLPVVDALGVRLWGTFEESASSVDDGADWLDFTRRRFAPDGSKTLTGGPSGTWQETTVRLKFVRESGDEVSDFDPVRAEVAALAGTLQNADQLRSPLHGFFEVRGVTQDGAYERARLER